MALKLLCPSLASVSQVKCWIYVKKSKQGLGWYPIGKTFCNEFKASGIDRSLILIKTTLRVTVTSSFLLLVLKVLVKHTTLSSWAETRYGGTHLHCKLSRLEILLASIVSFLERFVCPLCMGCGQKVFHKSIFLDLQVCTRWRLRRDFIRAIFWELEKMNHLELI